ncbi:MAG: LPS-assembly protein LptD, partial [Gammaproteobacteria bacterium]|nr:LPS-assembly protein LptD [Gammaproteobacteria bacterium]
MLPRLLLLLGVTLSGMTLSGTLAAQERGGLVSGFGMCRPALVLPEKPKIEIENPEVGATDIEADTMETEAPGTPEELTVLTGDVVVSRDEQLMAADEVRYRPNGRQVWARGNVQLWQEGTFLGGDSGTLSLDQEHASMEQLSFIQMQNHAHGTARQASLSGQELIEATDATYTTCAPGEEDWVL